MKVDTIVNSLLSIFGKKENEKLIKHLMKEDEYKRTSFLHLSLRILPRNEESINSLLNAFGKEKNEQLIQYLKEENEKLMKEDKWGKFLATCHSTRSWAKFRTNPNSDAMEDTQKPDLHWASTEGYKTIVNSLLNRFQATNQKLIDHLMTPIQYGYTVSQNVVLSQKLNDAENQKLLCDLYEITQMFKKQKKNCKTNLQSIIFDEYSQGGVKQSIFPFLFHDYDEKEHNI